MLTMEQYEYIRVARRVYGKSIKGIARETGHSKNTVRKVLRGEIQTYKKREKQSYPSLGNLCEQIDEWLEADKKSPVKQRHTARRVYNRLRNEKNFIGGESTVRRYVRQAKLGLGLSKSDVFIPGDPLIGQEAEVDWGTVCVSINGQVDHLKIFVMRSKYSGKHFVRCYRCERQQAFFDAHIHAFSFFGGVFPVIIYDNLSSAVQKIYRGKKRDLQESYTHFKAYYTFLPRFCTPGEGHEKGGVEGLIGYARRNYFVPIPEVGDVNELNERLLNDCHEYGSHRIAGRERSVQSYFEEEEDHLLPLPEFPFSNQHHSSGKVDKYATVIVDKNHYSVPSKYGHYKVSVVLSVDRVDIYHDRRKISSHVRVYGSNKWQLDPDHYLDLIQQRPQSFSSARPLRQWRAKWPASHEQLLARFCHEQGQTKGVKDFIAVLQLYRAHDPSEVKVAIELALEAMVSSSGGVLHLLLHTFNKPDHFESLPNWPSLPSAQVSQYGQLGGVL